MAFYVDTCVYLNLWKREERKGVPFWRIAEGTLALIKARNCLLYSGFVLKELKWKMGPVEFERRRKEFDEPGCTRLNASAKDYAAGRELERTVEFKISFFDCMHIILARREGAVLVTRDRALIDFGRNYCRVVLPEEILIKS